MLVGKAQPTQVEHLTATHSIGCLLLYPVVFFPQVKKRPTDKRSSLLSQGVNDKLKKVLKVVIGALCSETFFTSII
jgi:hypothetical protein